MFVVIIIISKKNYFKIDYNVKAFNFIAD